MKHKTGIIYTVKFFSVRILSIENPSNHACMHNHNCYFMHTLLSHKVTQYTDNVG